MKKTAVAIEVESGERGDVPAPGAADPPPPQQPARIPRKKDRKDCTADVDRELPLIAALPASQMEAAVERLLALEKLCRQSLDGPSTARVLEALVDHDSRRGDWEGFQEHVRVMSRRRGLIPSSVQRMVAHATDVVLSSGLDEAARVEILTTLNKVTEGKIYVEVERARLTAELVKMLEARGAVGEAAAMIQDIQVETFGGMEQREKLEYILEQMRVVLKNNDYARAKILSNKMARKVLAQDTMVDLRIRFHLQLIEYTQHEADHLATAQSYHRIFAALAPIPAGGAAAEAMEEETPPHIQGMQHAAIAALSRPLMLALASAYVLLAPQGPDQRDLLHRLLGDKALYALPLLERALQQLSTEELVDAAATEGIAQALLSEAQLDLAGDEGTLRKTLARRVQEHNLRVIARYYGQVRMARLSALLSMEPGAAEALLCGMVAEGLVWARIDRPAGQVSFRRPQSAAQQLNGWRSGVAQLLTRVEQTSHAVQREVMSLDAGVGGAVAMST